MLCNFEQALDFSSFMVREAAYYLHITQGGQVSAKAIIKLAFIKVA